MPDYSNGNVSSSLLAPVAGGGQMLNVAAAGWNALAAHVYRIEGIKIASNGSYSTYRTVPMQVEMKAQYGSNAATPGTSNHGWGLAIDTDDHYYVGKYGAPFGFQKGWSDASWEPWHFRYAGDKGHGYGGKDPGPDYSNKPPLPKWWKRVGNKIKQLRKRRASKKQRRKQGDPTASRKAELHRQIQRINDHIDRLIHRRKKAK